MKENNEESPVVTLHTCDTCDGRVDLRDCQECHGTGGSDEKYDGGFTQNCCLCGGRGFRYYCPVCDSWDEFVILFGEEKVLL